ncbi:hypothetical protein J7413_20085 [Shimia sp. R10_1]|uniref:patatin-like phospholipase family protein n=1 Tax=Shimia sp. R10_1 TaxID=2821095 RepID=UPI001ADA8021|nr:patatin-like phospholipase family protein [Shimia sp. R10_1]MBO9475840.1 hypothetical protein [Shimia sp. R10_1]
MNGDTPYKPKPWDPKTADARAAHAFLSELRTRIATQPLPFQHGDLRTALKSLKDLFDLARKATKEYPGCQEFADTVTLVLNRDLRPMTGKWHIRAEQGELNTRDGAVAFHQDLTQVQAKMQLLEKTLYVMAYGSPWVGLPVTLEEKDPFPGHLPFGIPDNCGTGGQNAGLIDPDNRAGINDEEAKEIRKRRDQRTPKPNTGPICDATGMAFSGGGIRSASFCLGVAQVLAQHRLLGQFDLFSSVSGGGYTAAFLTRRMVDGCESDVAAPRGPDTPAIQYLRRKAAYLDTGNLSQTLPRAIGLLTGMILQWTVPAAVVSLLTLALYLLNVHWDLSAAVMERLWTNAHWIALGSALLALITYAWTRRKWIKARTFLMWLFWLLAVGLTTAAILRWLYLDMYLVYFNNSDRMPYGIVALVAATLPALTRTLPMLAQPWVRRLGNIAVLVLAAIAIPAIGVCLGFWLYSFAGQADPVLNVNFTLPWTNAHVTWLPLLGSEISALDLVFTGTIAITFTAFFRVDINWSSPHWFYRDSLGKTFVRLPPPTARPDQPQPEDRNNISIDQLDPTGKAPYLLMNAVVNLPNCDLPQLHERKGDFFLFSKHYCGSPVTGYAKTNSWIAARKPVDLATAVATSGAAVAPQMALLNIPSARALLSFLNIRLGFWIRHPEKSDYVPGHAPGAVVLLREMFAKWMTEKHAWMMLTDGAHLENSGVYELLRRQCRFIVAVDASADAEGKFDTLLTLTRHARIDLGIEIHPAVDQLRPNSKTGLSPAHGILCDILYKGPNGTTHKGVMLYIKTTLTGNEEQLIQAYRRANPNFPNQSTADQFFDEHQFEAYRLLGVHSAESLLDPVLIGDQGQPDSIRDWLTRLYDSIPPTPPNERPAR